MVYKKDNNGDWRFSLANLLVIIALVGGAVFTVTVQLWRISEDVAVLKTKMEMHIEMHKAENIIDQDALYYGADVLDIPLLSLGEK